MRGHGLSVLAVLAVAAATRVLQLLLSSLPYNIDSFAQISIASTLLDSGTWTLDPASLEAYNLKMPGLPLLLGLTAAATGLDPGVLATPLILTVSLLTVLGTYGLAFTLTGRRDLATAAALVLALLGPFIFLSSTLMKEALALALLPPLLLAYARRADPRMRLLAAALLLFLPLVHHLATLMAFGFVAFLLLLDAARRFWAGRWSWKALAQDLVGGPALAGFAVGYYITVDLQFFTAVWQPGEVALFLAIALLTAAGGLLLTSQRRARPWFALPKTRRLASLLDQKTLFLLGALLLVLLNFQRPLFPATVTTSPLLLGIAVAYVPLALLALGGMNLYRLSEAPQKGLVLALFLAPLTVMLFALFRGLDPLSHVLLYRSIDFLDFGLALGIGTVLVHRMRERRRVLLIVLTGGALLLTLPLAYQTEAVLQVQNTTYRYEVAAMARLSTLSGVQTDQRLGDVLGMVFGLPADRTLPFRLAGGEAPPPGALLLLEANWVTRGAQVHPLPFLPVAPSAFESAVEDHHLLYHGGDVGNALFIVLSRG